MKHIILKILQEHIFELNFDFSEILSFLGITHNYKTNSGVFNNFVDKLDFDIKKV